MPKTPTILIVVGITGDLAARKLIPAIEAIAQAGAVPKDFQIVGTTRKSGVTIKDIDKKGTLSSFVKEHLEFLQMDVNEPASYERLSARLLEIEKKMGMPAQRLFYLSVPPAASKSIIEQLGIVGLADMSQTKILLEKPFGVDLASAKSLMAEVERYFKPEQTYRIDHYLAKEMAQSLVILRERTPLFRRSWNRDFIERIEICAAEEVGIEGRADFYEQTGALRDLVQSHLLQLTALVCMDPSIDGAENLPARRLEALKSLHIPSDNAVDAYVRRGQYEGYRTEAGSPTSTVETYVSLTLESRDARLAGIPITLVTGKKLGAKKTEIRIRYKKENDTDADELILQLQGSEGAALSISVKRPGYENGVDKKTLDFTYGRSAELSDPYGKVLFDAMSSNHDLFVSSDEVLESWRILAPVQEAWKKGSSDLFTYTAGTDPTVR